MLHHTIDHALIFYTVITYTSYITYGAVTLEVYSTFYHNNYGNCNFIADSLCDRYIFT